MGGGGGSGHFSGTKGASDWNPFSLGTMYAQAGNGNVATDAGGKAAPAIRPWNKEASIEHLDKSVQPKSTGYCAIYVREAIEAGGIHLNRSLNSAGGKAYGYGLVLEDAGFKPVPADTPPQAGDVVIIQQAPKHQSGHAAMYDGKNGYQILSKKIFTAAKSFETKRRPM